MVIADKLGDIERLQGKPIFFFIQACRGSKDEKILVDNVLGTKDDPLPAIAKRSDFFFSYATGPDTHAFRNDTGSMYITVLCTALNTYALKLDLMNIVHRYVDAYMKMKKRGCFHVYVPSCNNQYERSIFLHQDGRTPLCGKSTVTCV